MLYWTHLSYEPAKLEDNRCEHTYKANVWKTYYDRSNGEACEANCSHTTNLAKDIPTCNYKIIPIFLYGKYVLPNRKKTAHYLLPCNQIKDRAEPRSFRQTSRSLFLRPFDSIGNRLSMRNSLQFPQKQTANFNIAWMTQKQLALLRWSKRTYGHWKWKTKYSRNDRPIQSVRVELIPSSIEQKSQCCH